MTSVHSEEAETKTFRLSDNLSVEITVGAGGFVCEWIPEIPSKLTKEELQNYKNGRNELLARLSAKIGGTVVVVDL